MDYSRQHNLDVRIARIFNTYGPRMAFDDGRVVSNFITQGLKGERLTIYGDGSQTRSFCYVSDLVRGLIALMESDVSGPVNLGNPEEFSIRDLASQVSDSLGVEPRFLSQDLPTDDPTRRRPDISRAISLLGWCPAISLKDGLSRTIADFGSRMDRI
jgi:UDP-glucuronate decarboxylase